MSDSIELRCGKCGHAVVAPDVFAERDANMAALTAMTKSRDEARAEVEQLTMRWVPVTKRLPGWSVMVLAFTPNCHNHLHYAWIDPDGTWREHRHDEYACAIEGREHARQRVTHWCPLPREHELRKVLGE